MELSIKQDIEPIVKAAHANLVSVECRSSSCVATIGFASYADALQQLRIVGGPPNHAHCGSETTLDEPPETEPYRIAIVYTCEI